MSWGTSRSRGRAKRTNWGGVDEHHPARPGHGRDPGRHLQPRRGVLRRRRRRQDHHRRGNGVARRGIRPHRRRADHRPGPPARPGAGHQGSRQLAAAGPGGAGGLRRTARDDARHAPDVRRDGGPVLRTRTRTSDSGQPVLSDGGHLAGGHTGVHGDGEAGTASGAGQVGSGRRRHPAVTQCAGLPGRPETVGQLHGQPVVEAAARPGSRDRSAGHRRGRVGDEGAVHGARVANAFRRCGFRAVSGCHLRRVPREGRPHLRTAQDGAAPSSWWCRRPSPMRCARRRSSSTGFPRSTCRWPG